MSPNPPPPPPPPSSTSQTFTGKLRTKPPAYISTPPPKPSSTPAPTGPYFFYGTLSSPCLLKEILDLPSSPTLQSASITGYKIKLWGQYPALIERAGEEPVHGFVYYVESVQHGNRLIEYETANYRLVRCVINLGDSEVQGYTFVYAGGEKDLSDGRFDLESWLERMGR